MQNTLCESCALYPRCWERVRPLLLVCRSGRRLGRASLLLQESGFSGVYNLAGGMLAWNEHRLSVERM